MFGKHTAGSLDEKGLRYLTTITDSARRMGVLIDDLLALSRVGRVELRRTELDLARLIEEVQVEPLLEDVRKLVVQGLPRSIGLTVSSATPRPTAPSSSSSCSISA